MRTLWQGGGSLRVRHVGLRRILVLAVLAIGVALAAPAQAQDSRGTDFWLAFTGNIPPPPTLSLFITGDTATSGTVAVPGLAFSAPFTVTPGTITTVGIPAAAELQSSDTIENR